jgi:hypothetical protein
MEWGRQRGRRGGRMDSVQEGGARGGRAEGNGSPSRSAVQGVGTGALGPGNTVQGHGRGRASRQVLRQPKGDAPGEKSTPGRGSQGLPNGRLGGGQTSGSATLAGPSDGTRGQGPAVSRQAAARVARAARKSARAGTQAAAGLTVRKTLIRRRAGRFYGMGSPAAWTDCRAHSHGDGAGGWRGGMARGDGAGGWRGGMARGDGAGGWRGGMARGDGAAAGLGCAAAAAAFNLSCGAAAAGRRRLSRCRRPGGLAALARSGQAVVGGAGDELRGRGAGGGGRRM